MENPEILRSNYDRLVKLVRKLAEVVHLLNDGDFKEFDGVTVRAKTIFLVAKDFDGEENLETHADIIETYERVLAVLHEVILKNLEIQGIISRLLWRYNTAKERGLLISPMISDEIDKMVHLFASIQKGEVNQSEFTFLLASGLEAALEGILKRGVRESFLSRLLAGYKR